MRFLRKNLMFPPPIVPIYWHLHRDRTKHVTFHGVTFSLIPRLVPAIDSREWTSGHISHDKPSRCHFSRSTRKNQLKWSIVIWLTISAHWAYAQCAGIYHTWANFHGIIRVVIFPRTTRDKISKTRSFTPQVIHGSTHAVTFLCQHKWTVSMITRLSISCCHFSLSTRKNQLKWSIVIWLTISAHWAYAQCAGICHI